MARPTDYSSEIATKICEQIAAGESLRAICEADGMPDKATVFRWLTRHEEFRDQYVRAREHQMEGWADEILDIADDGTNDWVTRQNRDGSTYEAVDHDHINRSRLRVDTRKWLMSKLAPKKYGDKVVNEHTGSGGGPVKHEHVTRTIIDPQHPNSEGIPSAS